ncbi:MAG: ATP-binding protein [Polyangia bacterium]
MLNDVYRRRLESALRGAGMSLWEANLVSGELRFDDRFAGLLGREPDELPVDRLAWRELIHPDDLQRLLRAMRANAAGEVASFEVDYRARHADGSWRWVCCRGGVLRRDENGRPLLAAGTQQDIQHTRELEQRVRQAEKMETVGQIAGGVAHDFNNLLVPILAGSELVLDELKEGDPLREDVEDIRRAAKRAAALTRQLLAFSRRQVLRAVPTDLAGAVRDSRKMIRRVVPERVRIEISCGDGRCVAMVDPVQLQQVLLNLVINAVDAMQDGGLLEIRTRAADFSGRDLSDLPGPAPGRYAVLEVADDGEGMDDHALRRAFEPFFTTKRQGKGTGMGLATVYGIARQHDGFVTIDSAPGAGTTVRVHLPRVEAEPVSSSVPPAPAAVETKGVRVLVVEDNASVREVTARVLRGAGYRVLEAASAEEALVLAERVGDLDLLVTDLMLPGRDGRALAGRLTEDDPALSVLYMTGYAEMSGETGLSDPLFGRELLPKPFSSSQLLGAVARALRCQS